MSTGPKRKLAQAREDAEAFRELFSGRYEQWEIAGSVRRGKPEVGDIEHVVMPGDYPAFLAHMDKLLGNPLFGAPAIIGKAVYSDGSHRWGKKYRGCMFRDFRHEVFLADARNFGAILTIRTGPEEFSERMVTRLKSGGRIRQIEGYVRYVADGSVIAVPTERAYFDLCGEPWTEPGARA